MPRRFRRWPSLTAFAVVAAVVILSGGAASRWFGGPRTSPEKAILLADNGRHLLREGDCEILRVVDGLTLDVKQPPKEGHIFRVRLIGVGQFEDVDLARQAQSTLERLASPGPATIELDKRRAAPDQSWLAYVYVDGRLLNAEIIRSGWCEYRVYPGDSFTQGREMAAAQREAREAGLGVWRQTSK